MVFNLASITKQFTAVAILQLVDQGKLSLTDSIQKFYLIFLPIGHAVTIENLLTHTPAIKIIAAKTIPAPIWKMGFQSRSAC